MRSLAEQYDIQLKHAEFIGSKTDLLLVVVRCPGYPPRVSVIGNVISRSMMEIWRKDGSTVWVIDVVPGKK